MRSFRDKRAEIEQPDASAPTRAPADPGRVGEESETSVDGRSAVLTEEGWLVGYIRHPLRRVSDALAATRTLRLQTADGERLLDRDEVLLVAPPPVSSRPELRVPKRRYPVVVDVGPLRVHGQAHVLPGTSVWDAWHRSPSGFAPITEAIVDFPDGTSETAPVVLVSRHVAAAGISTSPRDLAVADGRGRAADWLERPSRRR
jgi:hypothetical protein